MFLGYFNQRKKYVWYIFECSLIETLTNAGENL